MSSTVSPGPMPSGPALGTAAAASAGETHVHRRISWSAIFGGVVLVVAVQLMLSLLGAGIGLGTVNTNAATTPDPSSLGVGAGLWWVGSSVIALAFGGYAAAWLAGVAHRGDGTLHGLITWGIASLITVYLLSSAIGGMVVVGASALGNGIKDAAQPVAQAVGVTPEMLQQQAQAYLNPVSSDPASMSPQEAQKAIVSDLITYAKGGLGAIAAKSHVVAIMAAQQHIPTEQASRQFDAGQSQLQFARDQAVQLAKNVADATAAGAAKTSFAAFAVLLIGGIAAGYAGSLAVQRRNTVAQRVVR